MTEKRYFLHEPILSVHHAANGHRECVYVPAGEVISVCYPNPETGSLVEVTWEGKKALMFQQDLDDRAELVQAAMPGAA